MTLKIKPAAEPPTMTRLSVKIPTPTADKLNAYLKAYEATYKQPTNGGFIVNEILLSFFNSDKDFQEFLKKNHENITSKQHLEINQPGRKEEDK